MRRTLNESGTATIEAVLSAPTLILLFLGFLACALFGFAKVWIRSSAYEATICLAAKERKQLCEDQLRLKIDRVVPGSGKPKLLLRKSANLAQAEVEIEFFGNWKMRERQMLPLPVIGRAQ